MQPANAFNFFHYSTVEGIHTDQLSLSFSRYTGCSSLLAGPCNRLNICQIRSKLYYVDSNEIRGFFKIQSNSSENFKKVHGLSFLFNGGPGC